VNISGGTIGYRLEARSGSEVNINGGAIGDSFIAGSGSEVNISGGSFHRHFFAGSGSDVELMGGEFRLNGADFSDSTISLATGDVFTGTLADGSAFIFAVKEFTTGTFEDVTLTSAPLPQPDLNPIVINSPVVSGPSGLRAGQSLTLQEGGSVSDNFAVVDATLNVEGGSVGDETTVYNSEVNIRDGIVGALFFGGQGSVVNVSGGTVGRFFDAKSGSEVNISGGTIGDRFNAESGSVVNVSGGTIGSGFRADMGSIVNISGGTFVGEGRPILADVGSIVNISGGTFNSALFARSELNIFGSEFYLDGVALTGLLPGQSVTITDRDVTLSGLLADGEQFSFDLNTTRLSFENDYFSPEATLTVTIAVPEPTSLTLIAMVLTMGFAQRRRAAPA
jgi:hypothetical protein